MGCGGLEGRSGLERRQRRSSTAPGSSPAGNRSCRRTPDIRARRRSISDSLAVARCRIEGVSVSVTSWRDPERLVVDLHPLARPDRRTASAVGNFGRRRRPVGRGVHRQGDGNVAGLAWRVDVNFRAGRHVERQRNPVAGRGDRCRSCRRAASDTCRAPRCRSTRAASASPTAGARQ